MDIISVTCAEIQTPVGFLYVIRPVRINQTNNPDCEQSWFSEDGHLLADPSVPHRMIDPVISVSSDRLVTSRCVNLNHEIYCDTSGFHFSHVTAFRVRNQTAATPNSDVVNEVTPDLQDMIWWISAPLIVVVLLGLICFLLRKRILRCFQRKSQFIRQQQDDDPDSRDLVSL